MANEEIQQALEEHVLSLPREDPGDPGMIGDWVAVVSMVVVDEEGDPRTEYYLVMRGGAMLPHIVKGLLREGIDEASSRTRED